MPDPEINRRFAQAMRDQMVQSAAAPFSEPSIQPKPDLSALECFFASRTDAEGGVLAEYDHPPDLSDVHEAAADIMASACGDPRLPVVVPGLCAPHAHLSPLETLEHEFGWTNVLSTEDPSQWAGVRWGSELFKPNLGIVG